MSYPDIPARTKSERWNGGDPIYTSLSSRKHSESSVVGWRFGIAGWILTVALVLVTNVALSIFVGVKYGFVDGLGLLVQGDCDEIDQYNTSAHVLINILSTLLLSGSNYCMQVLTAPSREDIDEAHSKGVALQVGIASFSNLWHIGHLRRWLWFLLAFSSVPLHLLYARPK